MKVLTLLKPEQDVTCTYSMEGCGPAQDGIMSVSRALEEVNKYNKGGYHPDMGLDVHFITAHGEAKEIYPVYDNDLYTIVNLCIES